MEALFGRYEAAALLAVERANGGELAPLEQVIVAFEALFGSSVTAPTFAESLALLIDAYLIDWNDQALELTLTGRKLIRRSGAHWDADFPDKVASKLAEIDEEDMSPEGELPAPSEDDVMAAMGALGRGRLEGKAPVDGDVISPSGMAGVQTLGARLLTGLPAGLNLSVAIPGVAAPRTSGDNDLGDETGALVPLVAPLEDAASYDYSDHAEDDADEDEDG